jgi:large subunit ribosomal protein L22
VDALYISRTVVNEGPKLKRFMPAAMGRATPVQKRTSHIEIELSEKTGKAAKTGRKR